MLSTITHKAMIEIIAKTVDTAKMCTFRITVGLTARQLTTAMQQWLQPPAIAA